MTIKPVNNVVYSKKNALLTFNFMPGQMLKNIMAGNIMLNLFETPRLDTAISNIYLRELSDNHIISTTPLLTSHAKTQLSKDTQDNITWHIETEKFIASVTLSLSQDPENIYYYSVNVKNISNNALTFDLIYGQDLSLSDSGATKTNESYCSQYLDHKIFNVEHYGYITSSRQNLPQSSGNPLLQLGSFSPVVAYSTDGYQFFGKQSKFTHQPIITKELTLANENYQYEMAFIALQLKPLELAPQEGADQVFYGYYVANQPEANIEQPISIKKITESYYKPEINSSTKRSEKTDVIFNVQPLSGDKLTSQELDILFPGEKSFEEKEQGELLSFFQKEGRHYITLADKEHYQERATGHIISSGNNLNFKNSIMNSTHYIYGVFNSHLTLGNTSFNKLLGTNRNFLNFFKSSGQRIQVKLNNQYHLLAMPSAYEVGFNFSRWVYKLSEGMIEILAFASHDEPIIQLDIKLHNFAQAVDVIVSHPLVMGNQEEESIIQVSAPSEDNNILITSANNPNAPLFSLSYSPEFTDIEHYIDVETNSVQYLMLKGQIRHQASLVFGGKNNQVNTLGKWLSFATEVVNYENQQDALLNHFSIEFSQKPRDAQKLNHTLHWFTHNALVHYSSPHGLEQPSGAAWGTRDVSQGPIEFFMSLGRYQHVEHILCEMYSHQYLETGNWPQWFMFDNYAHIQQQESHGDVVIWPLKALADYLLATNNTDILNTELPYTSIDNKFTFTTQKETLLQHIYRQLEYVIEHLVPGTHLSSYGDGDWDDTLQPANNSLRKNMVSGWTIPLTLQTFKLIMKALANHPSFADLLKKINDLFIEMEADYHKYLIKDGVISGFIHFNKNDVEYLLHPSDVKTNIKYRLLPANRSIISESFDKEMAQKHIKIILDNLLYPDGVRLMDKTAQYKAGRQSYFKRAELAANLGREVGLQYCHAHIRFIEALCKMGMAKELFENLFKISPIGIKESVPNAELRQANSYFSSSDAKFNDRYQAYDNFEQLKTGKVATKGGWRIYSSGPGIYINQIISNVLGLRYEFGDLLLDPVISKEFGDTSFNFQLYGKPVVINIYPNEGEYTPKRVILNQQIVDFTLQNNPYRTGGVLIKNSDVMAYLLDNNTLDIYL
ncbi:cellobiose phosphorylase [Proteus vulgaris]|uniref:GH36-type glycosyl hydrolase domain-containing protein n=1 Tax=Proteus vulgaris TaxID=585 RepID=UPI0018E4A8D8|nr:cellobiose phosphorylase [Proteus vulgaris]MBI6528783.1 cellobiose phosphorylase [Proteus vulgaris]